MKIALAGNPNSGKTTLFNALTGSTQYVGNWPGVTVEKKDGKLKGHKDVTIQDLPGIYSLSPYTLEEVVTRRYLINETPDAIINIIDGTNLERNLYLTTQLAELGIPMVLAVNMYDIIEKKGDKIDLDQLGQLIGCKAVTLSALKDKGTQEVAEEAIKLAHSHKVSEHPHVFVGSVEHALAHIEESIENKVDASKLRWFAVKVFERDEKVLAELKLDQAVLNEIEGHIADCEKEMDDDAESIITNQRYTYIKSSINKVFTKKNPHQTLSTSDKIDKIVTNRFLALPIFVLIMWFMYYISVSTVGDWMTGWVNDVLFAEIIPPVVETFLKSIGCAAPLISLINDGIIAGVGTVLGFVPQMALIFLFLAILEDSGYMARIAFIMDRLLRKFGLSGKSFIPILIGTGCGVPAVMGTRTIENEADRRMTIMLCTFIPCGAKTVIIGMISSAFFPGNTWIAPTMSFEAFAGAKQRVLMSATLGRSGELERITGIEKICRLPIVNDWDKKGLGRKFFTFPDLSLGEEEQGNVVMALQNLCKKSVFLVPDSQSAEAIRQFYAEHIGSTSVSPARSWTQPTTPAPP